MTIFMSRSGSRGHEDLDGQCGAWAHLFEDCLKVQGVGSQRQKISPNSDMLGLNFSMFYIKQWTYTSNDGVSGDDAFPYLNVPRTPEWIDNTYNFVVTQVTHLPNGSLHGQHQPIPLSMFNNHIVVKYGIGTNHKLYDPSYGKIHDSLEAFANAVSGYVRRDPVTVDEAAAGFDCNGDGNVGGVVTIQNAHRVGANPGQGVIPNLVIQNDQP